jgi:hypothetical protein
MSQIQEAQNIFLTIIPQFKPKLIAMYGNVPVVKKYAAKLPDFNQLPMSEILADPQLYKSRINIKKNTRFTRKKGGENLNGLKSVNHNALQELKLMISIMMVTIILVLSVTSKK